MKKIEPLQLQRLIDGRLADREISEIVQHAQENPGLWQQIGSAFVEDRVFRTAIGQFGEETGGIVNPVELAKKSDPPATQASPAKTGSVLAIAASLMAALTAGLIAGWYLERAQTGLPVAGTNPETPEVEQLADRGSSPGNLTPMPEMNQVADVEPDYHLQLRNADGSEMLSSEVPLYTLSNAKRIGYSLDQNRLPDEAFSIAIDSGYGLNQQMHYISGVLSDGRQFIVPVRTIHLSQGQ